MLLGKQMFPEELDPFPFDEQQYLRSTMTELRDRDRLGVDVRREICELMSYADKYPELKAAFLAPEKSSLMGENSPLRRFARTLGLNHVRSRIDALRSTGRSHEAR